MKPRFKSSIFLLFYFTRQKWLPESKVTSYVRIKSLGKKIEHLTIYKTAFTK